MKITGIKTLHCDAGWRTWSFIKVTTSIDHIVGWSEVTDSHGSPSGIEGVVRDLTPLLIGKDPREVEKLYWLMYSRTRQSVGSIISKAIGGIENALLDIKGKYHGVPVFELFGGPIRDRIPLYWSHFGTSRVRAHQHVNTLPIQCCEDVEGIAREARNLKFKAVKTNIPIFDSEPYIYMPGFTKTPDFEPALNADIDVVRAIATWLHHLNKNLGEIGLIIDLNYNFKPEEYTQIGLMLWEFGLWWIEIDSYDPKALANVRNSIDVPICSGENLLGLHQYRPFFENYSMDICSIDIIWNGFIRSLQIASLANQYEMNCTPHNFNSNLSTFISAQFSACIPNFRIMEYDVDDVRWRDDLCTRVPYIKDGIMTLSDAPGWGADVNEEVLHGHPRKI